MNTSFAQRQQALRAQLAREKEALSGLETRLHDVDAELSGLAPQCQQYRLLETICAALDQLRELGAAALFWGEAAGVDQEANLQRSRAAVATFNGRLEALGETRRLLLSDIRNRHEQIGELEYHLEGVLQAEEDAKFEFIVEREPGDRAFHAGVLPWSSPEEDRRRLRKILKIAMLLMLFIGVIPQVWKLPVPDRHKKAEIPERLVQMMKKKEAPKPIEKPREARKEEDPAKTAKQEDKPKEIATATPVQLREARARAETKGVLAFKDSFTDLIDEGMPSQLGADARISNAGRQALGGAPGHGAAGRRSLILAQAGGGSGGIAGAAISRGGVGSGSGSAIAGSGVAVGRATSSIAADAKEAGRPLGKGAGPSRTDEEIQIVFDKYKAALYRIYNRELRNDPTLRGKMVLALTIEPDGRVSACRVQSTDMNSPALSADIVARVLKFDFGAKEGVPATRILYPIDFLPAG